MVLSEGTMSGPETTSVCPELSFALRNIFVVSVEATCNNFRWEHVSQCQLLYYNQDMLQAFAPSSCMFDAKFRSIVDSNHLSAAATHQLPQMKSISIVAVLVKNAVRAKTAQTLRLALIAFECSLYSLS